MTTAQAEANATPNADPAANAAPNAEPANPAPNADPAAPAANAEPANAAPNADPAAPAASTAPDAAAMKAYLLEKTEDGATALEGKSDIEIASLFGAMKAKEEAEAEAAKRKAPEKYEEFKIADGVKISDTVKTKLTDYAKANNLSQESAQALVDLAPEVNKMFTEQLTETAKATSAKWASETKVDKEIAGGGDKEILNANMALVAKARNAFATPELMNLLNDFDPEKNKGGTGFGNHPEVVRLFLRLGKAISEDNTLVDGKEKEAPLSPAQKLYANTNKPK